MTTFPPSEPPADDSRGPRIPGADTLLRVVMPGAATAWIKPDGKPSSAMCNHPVFSVDVERLSSVEETLSRWLVGSGIISFIAADARTFGFDAHFHPENGNDSHANVYSDYEGNARKRQARALAERATVRVRPTPPAGS